MDREGIGIDVEGGSCLYSSNKSPMAQLGLSICTVDPHLIDLLQPVPSLFCSPLQFDGSAKHEKVHSERRRIADLITFVQPLEMTVAVGYHVIRDDTSPTDPFQVESFAVETRVYMW